jgi:hypothetical protein
MGMRTPEHLRALAAAEGEQLARQLLKTFDTSTHRDFAIGLGDVGLAVHWDVPKDGQLSPDELPIEAFYAIDDAGNGNGKLSFRELAQAFMALDLLARRRLIDDLRQPLRYLQREPGQVGLWFMLGFVSFGLAGAVFVGSAGLLWPVALLVLIGMAACHWRMALALWRLWHARREVIGLLDQALAARQPPEEQPA